MGKSKWTEKKFVEVISELALYGTMLAEEYSSRSEETILDATAHIAACFAAQHTVVGNKAGVPTDYARQRLELYSDWKVSPIAYYRKLARVWYKELNNGK